MAGFTLFFKTAEEFYTCAQDDDAGEERRQQFMRLIMVEIIPGMMICFWDDRDNDDERKYGQTDFQLSRRMATGTPTKHF